MNQVPGLSLTVFTQRQDPKTSKEMELRASLVLAKVGLNEGGRESNLTLTNLSSSCLFFSRTRENSLEHLLVWRLEFHFFHLG